MADWMWVGSLSGMMVSAIFAWKSVYTEEYDQWVIKLMMTCSSILWTVIGFILWSELEPQHPCSRMLLAWCIMEIIVGVFGPCSLYWSRCYDLTISLLFLLIWRYLKKNTTKDIVNLGREYSQWHPRLRPQWPRWHLVPAQNKWITDDNVRFQIRI